MASTAAPERASNATSAAWISARRDSGRSPRATAPWFVTTTTLNPEPFSSRIASAAPSSSSTCSTWFRWCTSRLIVPSRSRKTAPALRLVMRVEQLPLDHLAQGVARRDVRLLDAGRAPRRDPEADVRHLRELAAARAREPDRVHAT